MEGGADPFGLSPAGLSPVVPPATGRPAGATEGGARRRWNLRPSAGTALAAMLASALAGCGPPPMAETPIQRDVLVEDLLAAAEGPAGKGPKATAAVLRATTELPPGAVLRLQGRIWRDPDAASSGGVTFSVETTARPLFTRRLQTTGQSARFTADVPLAEIAEGGSGGDRPVELTLRIDKEDGHYAGAWQRATVHRLVATPRLAAGEGRNLLFIIVDTWRADHCSLYGYRRPTTPYLDAFAAEGLVFDNAISPSSWTSPAVASLLTGLYPLQHGVIHGEPLRQRFTTLAEHLQEAGFSTFAASANPMVGPEDGFSQGFETFHHIPWERADEVNRRFFEWLPQAAGLRWLAYLHYIDPHDPYDAPAPEGGAFVDPGYGGTFQRPEALNELFHTVNFGQPAAHTFGDRDVAHLEAAYDGEILYWDRNLGRLVEELRRRQLLERTAVIITSDHGEEFTEHGMFKHGHQLYDESVRVPLVIRAPGLVDGGRRRAQVEIRGLLRAALQLMGVAPAAPRRRDLLRVADNDRWPAFSHTKHQPAPTEPRRPVVAAVRDTDWKLIHWLESDRVELFHLGEDAGETTDVLDREAGVARKYRRLLQRWLRTGRKASGGDEDSQVPPDPELMAKLKALGYVQ